MNIDLDKIEFMSVKSVLAETEEGDNPVLTVNCSDGDFAIGSFTIDKDNTGHIVLFGESLEALREKGVIDE